jgi:hypothetical protein
VGCQRHALAALLPGSRPVTHFTGGSVEPRFFRPAAENLASTEFRFPDRPAQIESLYRVRHLGPQGRMSKGKKGERVSVPIMTTRGGQRV